LDFDNTKSYRLFQERYPKIAHLVKKMVIMATRPGHYHVYVLLKRRHRFVQLSALAVWLFSDPKRELSNLSRIVAKATRPVLLIEFTRVPHWRKPDLACFCPRKWKGKRLANCWHLLQAKGHKAQYGFLSTRLKIIGVKDPYGRS
jgi:hypothetical protein